jgi:Tfp pilus assembly protein PilO
MDKMRQWTLLTVVGIVAVLGAGWFLAVSPQRHHAADLRSQAATQVTANSQLQQRVAQLEQQKKGLPAQQRRLNQIAAKIPDNPALPALIRQLSAAADGAGVDLVSLSPAQPVSSTPAGAATTVPATGATTTTAGSAGAANVLQIPVTIQVQGSYFNIENFFDAVEKLPRAVLIPGWNLNIVQGSSSVSTGASGSAGSATGAPALPPGTLKGQINAVVFESPQVASAPTSVAPVATSK